MRTNPLRWTVAACAAGVAMAMAPSPGFAQCSVGTKVGDTCGDVSYEGCCLPDATLEWCEGGVLCALPCPQNPDPAYQKCGWSQSAGYYDCGTSTLPEPTCTHAYDCPGNCVPCGSVTYEGCCDGVVLTWCECGCLRTIDCGQNSPPADTCGWYADAGFYDCGQVGAEPTGTHPIECGGGPCVPSCGGKQCGDDGCGGSCGSCPAGYVCNAWGLCEVGTCVPSCSGKQCGPDGCGGSCGSCPAGSACNASGQCVPICTPNCSGKQCGDDGCGGSCGSCPAGSACNASGQCVPICTPNCSGKQCGDDGCGGSCGSCPAGHTCQSGQCVGSGCGANPALTCLGNCGWTGTGGCECDRYCQDWGDCCPDFTACCPDLCSPDCFLKDCGDDGCGGSCGSCPPGQTCNADGMCVSGGGTYPDACLGLNEPSASTCLPGLTYEGCCDSAGRAVWCEGGQLYCLDCSGNGLSCGWSADGGFYDCDQVGPDPSGQHPISCDGSCNPSCAGKECGPDGCGGSCGSCGAGETCNAAGQCVGCTPACTGKQCGPDGCGGSCGSCPAGKTCDASGQCVDTCTPSCAGKQCGDDGCGGSCGSCSHGYICQSGTCVEVQVCTPDCAGKECGPDGCDGSCGVCPPPLECIAGQCYDPAQCSPSCTGKECGPDGCGGSCGSCPSGKTCNAAGRCEATGLPDASGDAAGPGGPDSGSFADTPGAVDSAGGCPPGYVTYYGKCVPSTPTPDGTGASTGGGCAATPQAAPAPFWFSMTALLGLAAFGRRRGPPGS